MFSYNASELNRSKNKLKNESHLTNAYEQSSDDSDFKDSDSNCSNDMNNNSNNISNNTIQNEYIVKDEPKSKYSIEYNDKKTRFELYDYLTPKKIIGFGAYATVLLAIDERYKYTKKVAIKKNRNVFANLDDTRRILRELKLMKHFNHKNVASLTDVIIPNKKNINEYKDIYIVMPHMNTTLSHVIRSKQNITEKHVKYFVYQILTGIYYMHSAGVIHRDLKPDNILVNYDCSLKITDFGLSRCVNIDNNNSNNNNKDILSAYVVTRYYRAPEVLINSGHYDEKIDIFSVGCILAELYLRRIFLLGQNKYDQLTRTFMTLGTPHNDMSWIKSKQYERWILEMPRYRCANFKKLIPNASELAIHFMKKLLVLNPQHRIDAETAMKDKFLDKFFNKNDLKDKCPKFDLSFEYQKAIKTEFGIRHIIYNELIDAHKKAIYSTKYNIEYNI